MAPVRRTAAPKHEQGVAEDRTRCLPCPEAQEQPSHIHADPMDSYQLNHLFIQPEGWRLNHFPGQPVPMLDNPLGEEKFPNIQSKPPLAQLEAISSCPITCYLGEETDPHLSTASFQAKQSQLPQPLLIRLVLQTLHQLRCPSLHTLQHLNVPLVVRGPKLNTVFEVRPHQCRVQGHDHFPSPAGHTIFDTSQDAIGFLGHLGTLLAHIQVAVNKHPQVLLCWAAFQPLFPKPVALHGVAVAQVQDLALGLVKPHTIDLGKLTFATGNVLTVGGLAPRQWAASSAGPHASQEQTGNCYPPVFNNKCTRSWEGAQPGQLTPTGQRAIPRHMVSCPVYELGEVAGMVITARGLVGHQSVGGDPKKCQQRQQHLKVLRKKQVVDQGGSISEVEKTHRFAQSCTWVNVSFYVSVVQKLPQPSPAKEKSFPELGTYLGPAWLP
ncbi:hypothetical protein QYF61_003704 [Mycteria americana]|uniref:Uncharacterized protein n=1 Tax=Mycteria americana TaxID=33587 RepID=A0AAN7NEK3_MYCAM|nr:hypothetical protein QYF61_003704 [Mycteria americana]